MSHLTTPEIINMATDTAFALAAVWGMLELRWLRKTLERR